MSDRLAAGWARSRSQSVSVVPMIQCRPQGEDEEHVRLGPQDECGVGMDAVPRHDQVDPLGHAHPELASAARHLLQQLLGPHPGRVDHFAGADLDLLPRLQVAHPHAGDPLALLQEADNADAGGGCGAVLRSRSGHGHRKPGVVDLPVVVPDAADHAIRAQSGCKLERPALGQVPVPRNRPSATHRVVQQNPRAHIEAIEALPNRMGEWVQERDRVHQVRGEPREQQVAFPQRLPYQGEVALLQVAHPAVDELAGAAGGPGRVVTLLHQCYRQAAGRRVQSASAPGDPTAHDHDVEHFAGHAVQRRPTLLGTKLSGTHRLIAVLRSSTADPSSRSATSDDAGAGGDRPRRYRWGTSALAAIWHQHTTRRPCGPSSPTTPLPGPSELLASS